ncbi:MAG TPA: shikimate kinase [Burkholderiaceae bacterium]|nr:shikimate kinase [Burkholderiaceae bacterium]
MESEPGSVFLIGMMGAGKSTIGRLLARQLAFEFVDADREIEARSGVSIPTIFEVEGEEGFRRRESAILDELTQRRGLVIATGGGAVLREDNRSNLRSRGLVIYLQASADEIARRTSHDKSRPLLQTADPRARIVALLAQRAAFYAETAHLTFHSSMASPKKLVRRILESPEVQSLRAGS